MRINSKLHTSATQHEVPNSFIFSGIVSDTTTNGSVKIAQAARNKTSEKLVIGIQL